MIMKTKNSKLEMLEGILKKESRELNTEKKKRKN